ncbi:hypothetical protein LTR78_009404 [Recurvomyces mirabilis]|uniref:Uncharacterized protein n=1 Tax=Recurvomyces mirabilis TaxID=574656 RepID=A0AAE0TNR0_9PEZI|nr:hypothetical protein LTR78_009404 [Recurvomyces mirabilis]KAK5154308.1 hypothetical protein LTS14_006993 [Recurvomyces mirabilis]
MPPKILDPASSQVDDSIASIEVTTNQPRTDEQDRGAGSTTIEPFDWVEDPALASEAENQYPTGAKFWFITLSVALLLLVGGMDASIIATAVPSIIDHFRTVADIGWIFSVKIMLMVSTCIFMLGTILCASATSSKIVVLGRAVTGPATSSQIAGAFTLLQIGLPLRLRPVYAGAGGAVETVAVIAAPVLGGVLTQKLSWRWCFWISLPPSFLTLLFLTFFFSDPRKSTSATMAWREIITELDLFGTLCFVPGMTCLFLALTWAGSKYAFDSAVVLCLYGAFAVLLVAFVWDQHRKGEKATLPPRIFKQRSILAGFIFSLGCGSSLMVFEWVSKANTVNGVVWCPDLIQYLPTYYQVIRGYTPGKSGYLMLPTVGGFLVGMVLHGSLTSITGYFSPWMLLGSTLLPLAAGLLTTWTLESNLTKLVAYPALIGFAAGIGFQGPQSAAQTVLSDADGPLGLAVILFAQHFGSALFGSIAQTIFTNRLAANLHDLVPGLNASSVASMGFSEIRGAVAASRLQEVLLGLDRSLIQTWYLGVGLACMTMLGSISMEWVSVKHKKN